jgi:serine/threonine-protein kinase
LKRCLERDAKLRLHDVADARLDLLEAAAAPAGLSAAASEATVSGASPRFLRFLPWLLAALFAVAAAAALLSRKPSTLATPPLRARVLLASEGELMESTGAAVVASPDGSRLAFVMHRPSRLFVRPLDRLEAVEIPESDGAENPVFSPDGEWISFFSAGKLRRVPVTGGTPTTICAAPTARGATWITPDSILLAPKTAGGLALVSANGGEPRPVTTPNAAAGERTHRWPAALPGGKFALFMTQLAGADYDDGIIEAVEIASGKRTVLHRGGAFPRYVASGHLLFVRKGTLFAVTMDPSKPALTGRPVPVTENVMSSTGAEAPSDGSAQIDVAASGLAVYRMGQPETMYRLALLDRKGTELHAIGPPRGYARPRISPDGTRIAVVGGGQNAGDIWIYDVARDTFQRLTFEGNSWSPAWTPDSRSVAYSSDRGQKVQDAQGGGVETVRGIYVRRADGTGAEHFLLKTTGLIAPTGFSPDGRMLAFDESRSQTQADVAVIHLSESGDAVGEPQLVVASPRIDSNGAFSFDGKWLAYEVGDGGNPRIFLRAATGGDSKWQVSEDLGSNARWSRDGKLHFLKADGTVTAVSVTENAGAPVFGKEERLFVITSLQSGSGALALNGWDMSADGTRFVALKREVAANGIDANHVVVVSDFFQELRRLAPSVSR